MDKTMKVKILKTGKIEEYNAPYAARLIEQGKAVSAQPLKEEGAAEEPKGEGAAEEPKAEATGGKKKG
jgi:hypothetical protein